MAHTLWPIPCRPYLLRTQEHRIPLPLPGPLKDEGYCHGMSCHVTLPGALKDEGYCHGMSCHVTLPGALKDEGYSSDTYELSDARDLYLAPSYRSCP